LEFIAFRNGSLRVEFEYYEQECVGNRFDYQAVWRHVVVRCSIYHNYLGRERYVSQAI
jgi:hypothetical protein